MLNCPFMCPRIAAFQNRSRSFTYYASSLIIKLSFISSRLHPAVANVSQNIIRFSYHIFTGKKSKKAKWIPASITDIIAEPTTIPTTHNWAESVDEECKCENNILFVIHICAYQKLYLIS